MYVTNLQSFRLIQWQHKIGAVIGNTAEKMSNFDT